MLRCEIFGEHDCKLCEFYGIFPIYNSISFWQINLKIVGNYNEIVEGNACRRFPFEMLCHLVMHAMYTYTVLIKKLCVCSNIRRKFNWLFLCIFSAAEKMHSYMHAMA